MTTAKNSTAIPDIITPKLVLRQMQADVLSACLSGKLKVAEALLGAVIHPEITESHSSLLINQAALKADPSYSPWSARAIILPEENRMVGFARFHTTPNPEYLQPYAQHAVELGYQIFTPFRRKGYATETVKALMNWAQATYSINRFVASVAPGNIASLNLIQHLSFKKIGELTDDVDGCEYLFLREIYPAQIPL